MKESYTAATATTCTSRSSGIATCTSPAVSNVIPEETADASFVASNSPAHRPVMVHAEESTDTSLVAMEDSSNLNVEDTPALVLKRPLNLPMTSTPKPNTKCNQCSRKSKKTRKWRKNHQRLNKRFQALLVRYNQLKNTQVFNITKHNCCRCYVQSASYDFENDGLKILFLENDMSGAV